MYQPTEVMWLMHLGNHCMIACCRYLRYLCAQHIWLTQNIRLNWLIISKYTAKHICTIFKSRPGYVGGRSTSTVHPVQFFHGYEADRTDPLYTFFLWGLSFHFSYGTVWHPYEYMCMMHFFDPLKEFCKVTQTYRLGMFSIFQPDRQRFLKGSLTVS